MPAVPSPSAGGLSGPCCLRRSAASVFISQCAAALSAVYPILFSIMIKKRAAWPQRYTFANAESRPFPPQLLHIYALTKRAVRYAAYAAMTTAAVMATAGALAATTQAPTQRAPTPASAEHQGDPAFIKAAQPADTQISKASAFGGRGARSVGAKRTNWAELGPQERQSGEEESCAEGCAL